MTLAPCCTGARPGSPGGFCDSTGLCSAFAEDFACCFTVMKAEPPGGFCDCCAGLCTFAEGFGTCFWEMGGTIRPPWPGMSPFGFFVGNDGEVIFLGDSRVSSVPVAGGAVVLEAVEVVF